MRSRLFTRARWQLWGLTDRSAADSPGHERRWYLSFHPVPSLVGTTTVLAGQLQLLGHFVLTARRSAEYTANCTSNPALCMLLSPELLFMTDSWLLGTCAEQNQPPAG